MKPIHKIILALVAIIVVLFLIGSPSDQQNQIAEIRTTQAEIIAAIREQKKDEDAGVKEVASQLAKLNESLSVLSERADKKADERATQILAMIEQQTALLSRALGKAIPIEVPDSVKDELAGIEKRLDNKTLWPKDGKAALSLLDELADVVEKIPAWAEQDILPRMNAIRWNAQSLYLVRANENAFGDTMGDVADALESQISNQPKGSNDAIADEVGSLRRMIGDRIEKFKLNTAIQEAEAQIKAPLMGDALAAWERLAEWPLNPEAVNLRKELRLRIINEEVQKLASATKDQLKRVTETTDDNFRRAAIYNALQKVTAQRLALIDETDAPEEALKALGDLSAEIQESVEAESKKEHLAAAARNRDYQKWALKQIDVFWSVYSVAKNQSHQTWGGLSSGTHTNYAMVADAMINHLLPISPGYLDTAVGKQYTAAFEDAWNTLSASEAKPQQTRVAQFDATTPKVTPVNFEGQK
jgi:hypothetical protein